MGEPAYKLPEEDKPEIRPNLRALEGGGETTPRSEGHLSSVGGDQEERDALYNPSADDKNESNDGSSEQTAAPSTRTGGGIGSRLTKSALTGGLASMGTFFWGSRKRKTATIGGGGIVAIFGGAFVAMLIFLAPLKIVSMVQNLQNHFFGASEQASGDITEYLMKRYIVKKVMPGMVDSKCNSTRISKSCAKVSNSSTPVGQLFNAWKDAKLENKLAEKYGIEIIKDGNNNFYMRTDSLQYRIFLGEYTPGDTATFDNKVFTRMNRSEVRTEMRSALASETLWKSMMHKYGVGPLLERKYGIRRCLMACKFSDGIHDKVDSKRAAFKSYLVERTIAPRSEMYALAINCAMSSFNCTSGDQIDEDGTHSNQFDRDVQAKLLAFREAYGSEALDKLFANSQSIREKGITGAFIEKIAGELAGRIASKAIPIVGWIDLGATFINVINKFGPAVSAINYRLFSAEAISVYMLYRTPADELKTGKADATIVGSIADSLNAVEGTDQGGLAADQVRLYQSLNETSGTGTSLASIVSPQAEAASVQTCNDDSPIDKGEIECPEMIVGVEGVLGGAKQATEFIKKAPMFSVIAGGADIWSSTAGKILGLAGPLVKVALEIPPFNAFKPFIDKAQELGQQVMLSVVKNVFPSQLGNNPSGGRLYEIAAAGADFSANDFAHSQLGAQQLTNQEVAEVKARQQTESDKEFSNKTLFARMFDTSDSSSLVSKIALSTPTTASGGAASTMSSVFTNPLKSVLGGFGSLIPTTRSNAASGEDPFGISQYGIPQKVINSIGDPEAYWTDHCMDMAAVNKAWGEKATLNPDTGQYENDTTNLCKSLQSVIGYAGGKYDTDLLPDDARTSEGAPSSGAGTSLRISTYNIEEVKQGEGETLPKKEADYKKIMCNIKTNKMDVIGTQEMASDLEFNYFKNNINTVSCGVPDTAKYALYPENAGSYRTGLQERAIMYNSDKFSFVKAEQVEFQRMNDPELAKAPVVWLEDTTTHQQIIVMNTHNSAGGTSGLGPTPYNGPLQRYEAGKKYAEEITKLESLGLPIFFTGDFNEAAGIANQGVYQGNLANTNFCQVTNTGVVKDVELTYANNNQSCTDVRSGTIDRIYASKSVAINSWNTIPQGYVASGRDNVSGTDHAAHYADVTVPGSGSVADTDLIASLGVTKMMVVIEENHTLAQMKSGMPYAFSQASKYAYTTNYQAITHPSLPNYIVMAAGSAMGVTNDALPASHKLAGQTVFGQAISSGKTAKVYAESMGSNCNTNNTGDYLARHNPWTYFVDEKGLCNQFDVPLSKFGADVNSGNLPNVGMLVPNSCSDAHDCPLSTADNWFKARMQEIYNGPDWKSGKLLVVLTADEDDKSGNNTVLTALMHPNLSGVVLDKSLNHFSLSQLYSKITGNGGLREAATAPGFTLPAAAAGGDSGWVWPATNIHSGPCWDASYYGLGHHAGMDMNSNVTNNPALAAHNGTVSRVGTDPAAGNYVTVRVGANLFFSYEHLASGSIKVTSGDNVTAGQQIATVGTTGDAPHNEGHLHMTVSVDGELGGYSATSQTTSNTRNPLDYLPKPAPNGYTCTNS